MHAPDALVRLRGLIAASLADLFDQRRPFGRLALVQVLMIAGDTLVTISLAGSLFFSISPSAAKSKVLLYLLLTIAPFAIVSPLLGPMIDRSRGARRAMVVVAALGRAVICPFMARDLHSLLLFPEAFAILVLSKVYGVTKGALVPEMAAHEAAGDHGAYGHEGYASWNAQLTLLGTLAGFVISIPGVILLKTTGSPGVLILCSLIFLAGAICATRLPVVKASKRPTAPDVGAPSWGSNSEIDRDLQALQPIAHPEVLYGLTANSLLRGIAGFLVFLIAFGLRRQGAPLYWYGIVLGASGAGALLGLAIIPRVRKRMAEQQIILGSMVLIVIVAIIAAWWDTLAAQSLLALAIGVAGSLAQPSFDAMTQRYVPVEVQGRAFARFATRQQLIWVFGALIPVVIAMPLAVGDTVIAVVGSFGAILYLVNRRNLSNVAVPGQRLGRDTASPEGGGENDRDERR